MADEVAEEARDMGDGALCSRHPLKKSPAGICGFCLQEKLGNLVSSATMPILGRSSPSPSFRSDIASVYGAPSSSALSNAECHARRWRMPPFLLSRKKTSSAAFSRSKSTTTSGPRRVATADADKVLDSRRRRKAGLWPFLNLMSSKPAAVKITSNSANPPPASWRDDDDEEEEERKVGRSRSVGCGSRSFSLGDCTLLRRAESQRQPKPIKSGRRRCGGIFGGFMLTSSSSSSSSSSRWVSDDINKQVVGNGQQKSSWGWRALISRPAWSSTPHHT